MENSRLRIGFDARLAGPGHAGIGRYSEELLKRLLLQKLGEQKIHWIVWVRPNHGMSWLDDRAATGDLELRTVDFPHYGLAEQTIWAAELWNASLDLLHVPHFNVPLIYHRPFIVTIHDLLWHTQRDARATTLSPLMHRLKYAAYTAVSESAIRRAQAVIVPSRQVQLEVANLTGRRSNVFVTYEGIPEIYRSPVRAMAKRESFMVYTGSLYPHKNIEVVLKALQKMEKMTLKIASTRSVFMKQVQERARALGVENKVEFLGFVPDEELIQLYRRARALIQPSKSEGFGLTGLEAMAVGCPVIASSLPIFKEIYAEHAHYFDPDDARDLIKALQEAPPASAKLQTARQHALSFSWDRMVQETTHVYETVLAHLGP